MSSAFTPPSDNDLDFGPTLRGLRKGLKVFDARYTLVRQLGRGGMGVVWLARDEKLELEVALKFLPEHLKDDLVAVDELRRETKRCLLLTHPNIVRIFDLAEDEELVAIAMEYVEGGTLAALRLEKPTRCFEAAEVVPWLRQVCEALSYAHERARVVHRDLKPSNIMASSGGGVKLADFGIASSLSDTMSRMTRAGAGAGAGTLVYMSPQQLMGYPPSVSDDVYALGATIYELLTGKPPFFRGSIERQIESVVPPSITERRAELGIEGAQPVPALWEEVIAACLEKEAEKRPRSVAELWQRLNGAPAAQPSVRESVPASISNPTSPIADQSSSVTRSRKPVLLALAALVCVGGALGWWYGYEQPRQERARLAQQRATDEEQVRQAAARRTMEVAALVSDGRKAYEAADYGTARVKLEAALVLEPQHAEAVRLLDQVKTGEAQRQQEQMAAAELAKKKSEAAALVSEARTLFNGKDYDGAKQKISAALYLVPGDSAAVALRGEVEEAVEEQRKQQMAAAMAAKAPVNTTKEQPFTNSLGMKFVAVPGTSVLMCVHETRNADYAAYAAAQSGVDEEWKEEAGSGKEQHPVVYVNYEDAEGFCRWLSAKEGKTYRLPTDAEWSAAVGLPNEQGRTPAEKEANGTKEVFPWGRYYPPKPGDGNYDPSVVDDGYEESAPVMSFRANELGIYDLGGNVIEWCQDWYDDSRQGRVLRGASWHYLGAPYNYLDACVMLRSSFRDFGVPIDGGGNRGFRCVLVLDGG
jgi:serine/threonine protein kinase/formylglycine-generating enzyme required for sulfatase activity